ncbi:MAG: thioredoxin domain-containing protein, partial [Myxococcales bacterium]|nr:thioredoxin domain-containing protein [Myxococcales bacterium]
MAHAAPPPGDGRPKNRLAQAASPYLRQHAHNPVDWHPWGDEALALARRDDRPILLSVGYSACHWCHVMERESFDDPKIAAAMNASFVCIKVDREEMPDLDHVYQLAVQLLGRSGGWPLTVFLTPDLRPFFGGTYFPPNDRHGLPGFAKVLSAVAGAWADKRADVLEQASDLAAAISRITRSVGDASSPGPDLLARACQKLAVRFDAENGGFGQRPKFP